MSPFLRALAATLVLSLAVPGCNSGVDGDEQNASSATGRFETFKGDDGQTYFQLLAKNGESLLRSDGYASVTSAKNGIASVKKNGLVKTRFKLFAADTGEYYFDLYASNGQLLGASDLYASKSAAQKGIDAVIAALASPTTSGATVGGAHFETFKGADKKSYFRLRAANGQIVLASQGYSSSSAAQNGIDSVETNGVDATRYELSQGASGQWGFRLVAANGQIIGRSETYASKSNAVRGANGVRDIVRDLTQAGAPSDAEIQGEIEKAYDGLLFTSESDYPFQYVSGAVAPGAPVDEGTVRKELGAFVDADPGADKPMSSLFSMAQTWDDWKGQAHQCADPNDPASQASCEQMRNLEQVLEANLTDLHVYYFGAHGKAGQVDGIGVSVFIVGRTPQGTLAGVRTLAIWT